jgi:hypothetical protein
MIDSSDMLFIQKIGQFVYTRPTSVFVSVDGHTVTLKNVLGSRDSRCGKVWFVALG